MSVAEKGGYIPPTLDDLTKAVDSLERIANDLDFARRIEGLSGSDKTEIWGIVLQLTRSAAALNRIETLNRK